MKCFIEYKANFLIDLSLLNYIMFGEKGCDLLKDLQRSSDNLPPFNDEGLRQVLEEIKILFQENHKDVNSIVNHSRNENFLPTVTLRHAALERNKRCILAYVFNRLQRIRKMRWEFGSILPPEIKINLSKNELDWFMKYTKILAVYMGSIGDHNGLNLTQDMKPPKSLYIEVKSVVDFGKFELDSGEVILLKKNGVYHLPRSQCEILIRQGILEHIT